VRVLLFVLALSSPTLAFGQAQIAGIVRDPSGAVLPGVSVEAVSPALIEKSRTVVTDGAGQYRIVDLRPGSYTVTFALPGFSSVKREGIELTGSFTATINAEMKVGAVEETVTVTGTSPTVDVQSAKQQRVFDREVLEAIPTGRTPVYAAVLVPGVTVSTVDVGGTNNLPLTGGQLTIHGSAATEQRVYIDGLSTHDAEGTGAYGAFVVNMAASQEVTVDYAAGTAEQSSGGVQTNVIPREGGNRYVGTLFATGVNNSFQGSNYTAELAARGLRTPNTIKRGWDINPGAGGPILKDQLWFFAAARFALTSNYIGGLFQNKNAGDATKWTYEPDTTSQAFDETASNTVDLRLTWRANSAQKFSAFYDQQGRCTCSATLPTVSQESADRLLYPIQTMASVGWNYTPTNRLLVEIGTSYRRERYVYGSQPGWNTLLVGVQEQGGLIPGLIYRGGTNAGGFGQREPGYTTLGLNWHTKASVSYVTGSHAFKVGLGNNAVGRYVNSGFDNPSGVSYTFRDGVPVSLVERATPWEEPLRQPYDLGIYAQDKWTLNRLTLSYGLRYDYFNVYSKAQHLGPGLLVPRRNLDIPQTTLVNFKDVSPRLAGTYDLFGTGKTALKASLNKYMGVLGPQLNYLNGAVAPIHALANTVTRSWNDLNHNYIPDCDLTNVLANGGECGTVSNTNFGRSDLVYSQTNDPRAVSGWGNRPYQWEFSGGVQQQLAARIAVEGTYFRRGRRNFTVIDNNALSPSDYTAFTLTAPVDPRLPDGGGYIIGPLYDRNPDAVSRPPVNVNMPAGDYGTQQEKFQGVDLTVNARPRGGVILMGGLSAGQQVSDNCEILAKVPESAPLGVPYCHREGAWRKQIKFVSSYTIPRFDVQVSAAFQSFEAPTILASYVATNAQVAGSLGRDLSAGAQTIVVDLVEPGSINGDRLNQLDLRFGKIIRTGKVRSLISLDLYNTLNTNAALSENSFYRNATVSGWRIPTSILTARFFKISAQLNF